MSNISTLGFNGEYLDDTLENYHLGNGYRAYNPTTMQFSAPDDMSPFGAGGINPYMYCSCDPINNTDPTGHFNVVGTLGLVVSIATVGLSGFTAYMTGGLALAAREVILCIVSITTGALSEYYGDTWEGYVFGAVSIGTGVLAAGGISKFIDRAWTRSASRRKIVAATARAARRDARLAEERASTRLTGSTRRLITTSESDSAAPSSAFEYATSSERHTVSKTLSRRASGSGVDQSDFSRPRAVSASSMASVPEEETRPWRFSHEFSEGELEPFEEEHIEKLNGWKSDMDQGMYWRDAAKANLRTKISKLETGEFRIRFQGGQYPRMKIAPDNENHILHIRKIGPHD